MKQILSGSPHREDKDFQVPIHLSLFPKKYDLGPKWFHAGIVEAASNREEVTGRVHVIAI